MVPFHLAFPVRDIETTRTFYSGVLGCPTGRETATWIDFDFFGHQLSAHVHAADGEPSYTDVDGKAVPLRHFGAVLAWHAWEALAERVRGAGCAFLVAPQIRFAGEAGEQGTFFLRDPSGNALEFKAFKRPSAMFV